MSSGSEQAMCTVSPSTNHSWWQPREYGPEALESYTRVKSVVLSIPQEQP